MRIRKGLGIRVLQRGLCLASLSLSEKLSTPTQLAIASGPTSAHGDELWQYSE
jgi:hypothetical protein